MITAAGLTLPRWSCRWRRRLLAECRSLHRKRWCLLDTDRQKDAQSDMQN